MNEEIKNRLIGLERIVVGLHHNAELLQYMSFNLHQETFNLVNNTGLFWIWTQILGVQIINIYKVMMKDEKCSFLKIINVAKENKLEVNYDLLENEIEKVMEIFNKTDIECIRDKYIAHQDLQVPRIESDLRSICDLSNKITALFHLFANEFEYKYLGPTSNVVESFNEIFSEIDEYELVKAVLFTEELSGNDSITISKLAQEIEKYQMEIKKKDTNSLVN